MKRRKGEVKGKSEAYDFANESTGGNSDDVGTTVAVCGGRHCGSVLEDSRSRIGTVAVVVDYGGSSFSVGVRTSFRGAYWGLMSV